MKTSSVTFYTPVPDSPLSPTVTLTLPGTKIIFKISEFFSHIDEKLATSLGDLYLPDVTINTPQELFILILLLGSYIFSFLSM